MPPEQIVALASVILTAITGLVLAVFKALFDAWRKGELVSRTLLDQLVKLLTDENAELRETNVVLRREYLAAGEEIKRLNAILIDRAK